MSKLPNFRLVMEAKGHTVDSLVRCTDLSSSTLYKLAAGAKDPGGLNLSSFLQLCKALQMRPEELMRALDINYYGKR